MKKMYVRSLVAVDAAVIGRDNAGVMVRERDGMTPAAAAIDTRKAYEKRPRHQHMTLTPACTTGTLESIELAQVHDQARTSPNSCPTHLICRTDSEKFLEKFSFYLYS